MMRRGSKWNKKVDPNAPPPPVDPRSPPAMPKELVKAQLSLIDQLGGKDKKTETDGFPFMVAPGFGFGDMADADRTAKWRLYVFSSDPKLVLPKEVMEFEVVSRAGRVVPNVWGRKAR